MPRMDFRDRFLTFKVLRLKYTQVVSKTQDFPGHNEKQKQNIKQIALKDIFKARWGIVVQPHGRYNECHIFPWRQMSSCVVT